MTITPLMEEMNVLIDEITTADSDTPSLSVAMIDLIVTSCGVSLQSWAANQPDFTNLGILLLEIQLRCLHFLQDNHLTQDFTSIKKDG